MKGSALVEIRLPARPPIDLSGLSYDETKRLMQQRPVGLGFAAPAAPAAAL